MRPLPQLVPSESAEIVEIQAEAAMARRFNDMGLRVGERVEFVGRAPFSGPYIIRVHGATFALREGEAACIQVRRASS